VTAFPAEFRPTPSTDGYVLEIPQLGTELRVERVRRERGELIGELTVASNLPGTRSATGILHVADFNLSSARARTERAKILAERANTTDIDWTGLLEQLCQATIEAERAGQPAMLLRDLARPVVGEDLVVDGIRLLRRHPVILFGDGGDAKSYIGLYLATRLAEAGLGILYVDWEFAGEDHRDRLERLCGPEMPGLWYVRAERPLVAEVDRLRRIVATERIDYLVADSIAFACDGPPEAAEVAADYFRALRRIGIGSLNIAHITKGDNGDQKPFGSTFWHNGARSTIYIKRSSETTDEGRIEVGLYNRKTNMGPLARPTGYRIEFGEERTTFARIDLASVADLASKLSVRQRMLGLLQAGSMTMVEIASQLEVPVDTVVKTAKRGDGKVFVRLPGSNGIYRIGLLAAGDGRA
jgi:hypothetical protein